MKKIKLTLEVQLKKYLLAAFLIFLLSILCGFPVRAKEQKTVRVGCVDIEDFLVLDEQGKAHGYAAEYLTKMADYTGWDYEYVTGSWSECLDWLRTGEIDLLMPAEYSEERGKDYLFSRDYCCMDYAALIGRKENDKFYYADFSSFDGMTVGCIEDNYLNEVFDQYAAENDFSVIMRSYPNSKSLENALEDEEVDAIINGNMNFHDTQKLLAKIDYMPAYFITSVSNQELMVEVNAAQHQIYLENPYYVALLHQKYYGKLEQQAVGVTREEAEYIEQTGKLRVLCNAGKYPISWYDEESRSMKGFYADVLKLLSEESGMQFEIIGYESEAEAAKMIEDGEADMLFDVVADTAEEGTEELRYTDVYYEMPYTVITSRGKDPMQKQQIRTALPQSEAHLREWLSSEYPEWEVTFYDTWEDCVEAVKNGKADILSVSAISWQTLTAFRNEPTLINVSTDSFQVPLRIGIASHMPDILKDVLNKMIHKMDTWEIQKCVLNNTVLLEQKVSLKQLVRQYPLQTALIGIMIAVLVVFLVALLYIDRLKLKQNRMLSEKNAQLEEANRIKEELTKQVKLDKLTQLLDKVTAQSSCEQYLSEGGTGALLIIDVDNFKEINDSYGHIQGDEILKKMGENLRFFSREEDIAGRIGGDEFLLFFKGMTEYEVVEARVKAFQTALEQMDKSIGVAVSCSIGVAVAIEKSMEFQTLFREADRAMYMAKQKGKNSYHFFVTWQ